MNVAALPFAGPSIESGARALYLEAIIDGGGRKRLRAAYPARVEHGRWQVDRKGSWKRIIDFPLPDAMQMPDGTIREVGTGLVFDSRLAFLKARGAVRTMSPPG